MSVDALGWLATAVLVATLWRQMLKQWRSDHPAEVSRWLFIGQTTASLLFVIYSALLGSTVFVVTNLLLLITAITGHVLSVIKRKRHAARRRGDAGSG